MSCPVRGIDFPEGQQLARPGDQETGALMYWLVVNRSRPPLPSASCQKIFSGPSLLDSNAIRLPSGVQTGL